jgi:hypothetical protein
MMETFDGTSFGLGIVAGFILTAVGLLILNWILPDYDEFSE